jgi:hypothetical protein
MMSLAIGRGMFARPPLGNCPPLGFVVHHKNQPVIVIAVQHFDIDPSFRHPSRDLAELTRFRLLQSLHDYVPLFDNPDARSFKRTSSRSSILEEKVCHTSAIGNPCSSAFNANSGSARGISHFCQRTGPILQRDR